MEKSRMIRRGSANVFADLGFSDPEGHLLKARLVSHVRDMIDERGLTQAEAGRIMNIGQPDVSRILKGNFRDVSVERLMRLLQTLGYEIDIVVRRPGRSRPRDTISLQL